MGVFIMATLPVLRTYQKSAPFGEFAYDQAGRFRISQPIPLGDYKCVNDRLPLFFDTVTNGTATVEYEVDKKGHYMQTAADGDWAIVQTFQTHNYFAGKGQFVEFTTFDFENQTNIEKRIGYYTSSIVSPHTANLDGFYIYTDGQEHYLRIMNNGTEILNLPQSEWDDPLDGNGASGITINWETFNVFQCTFLWLGGTGFRLSLVRGDDIYLVIDYDHTASANADKLLMASPNQCVRYEIRQTGAGSGKFVPVCATIATEGSEASADIGSVRSVNCGASDVISASAGTEYLVKGIQLKTSALDVTVDLVDVDPFVESVNDFFIWRVHLNPTIAGGAPTWNDVPDSSIQESTGDGTLNVSAAGTVIASGYGSSQSSSFIQIQSARKLGAAIDGTRDQLWLTIEPIQGSTNLNSFGAIIYKEFI